MRRVFIDCGANLGNVLSTFIHDLPDRNFYAFEPNATLIPSIVRKVAEAPTQTSVEIFHQAIWTHDGTVDLFLGHHESSTVMPGKRVPPIYHQQIDYEHPIPVPAVDFSAWLQRTIEPGDDVIVKMDIEGAEYPVLTKLLVDNTIDLITVLYIEWHHDRFSYISRDEHDRLVRAVTARTTVREWD
jgi:FkbM family methyltransferase